jgi:hypothetical protein
MQIYNYSSVAAAGSTIGFAAIAGERCLNPANIHFPYRNKSGQARKYAIVRPMMRDSA